MSGQLLGKLTGRFLQGLLTLWLVSILFFIVAELSPGDFASASATQDTSREMLEAMRFRLGLYDPAHERYFAWLARLLEGDLGRSWWADLPVAGLVADRLGHTLWLFALATLVAVPVGLALAIFAATHRGGLIDRFSSWTALGLMSIPDFVIAYALIIVLALNLNLFPVHTLFALEMSLLERLHASALPILSLAAVTITPIFRLARAALIDILETDYIQMAALKGLSRRRILVRHALPNVIGPISNGTVLAVANLFFGLVVIEVIFSYPGLGSLLVIAASQQDMPVLLALGLISGVLFVTLNFLADAIAMVSNPRLRLPANPENLHVSWGWPDPRRWSRRRLLATAAIGLALLLAGSYWTLRPNPKYQVKVAVVPAPTAETREKLTLAVLQRDAKAKPEFLHYDFFKPYGTVRPPAHELHGQLRVPVFSFTQRILRNPGALTERTMSGFTVDLITYGSVLLPLQRDRLLKTTHRNWRIILSPGRLWQEPADGDWSRASFPFTLVHAFQGRPHYGVMTFAYNDREISQLRMQIAQETVNYAQVDAWGQTAVKLERRRFGAAATAARQAYDRLVAQQLEVRPWSELAAKHLRSLEAFDGEGNRHNISVSGLMIDDVFYLRDCRTRAGPHPFCRHLRHGIFSITKTIGAAVSLFWLAHRFGPEVLDEKILDHVKIPARHKGWHGVTFRHALDMVTGIGDVVPERVNYYVEADRTSLNFKVLMAKSIKGKLEAMANFPNYPWDPGAVFRYRSADTTVLAAAMQAYVRKKLGPEADIWNLVTENVLLPLGIDRLPVRRTIEQDGRPGVPLFGWGMFATYEEALKIARLFQDGGKHKGRQLIHGGLARRAVSNDFERGHPNGWRTRWGEGHYELSFWLTPHKLWFGCKIRIPIMSGFGGNYVVVMPNRTIGLRFADGHDDDRYTWDSSGIRNISNRIRSFC